MKPVITYVLVRLLLGGGLAAGSLLAGSPASNPAVPTLAVAIASEKELPWLVWQSLRKEFERALQPLGLQIEWWPETEDPTGRVAQHLISAKFLGACGTEDGSETKRENPVEQLGFTHVSEGFPIPYIEVDCEAVRGVLSSGNDSSRLARFPSLLGQALGRVLAHESYHALARNKAHSRSGIAKPNFTLQDLLDHGLDFETDDIRAMRSQLRPAAMQRQAEPTEAEAASWIGGRAH
jgi:hypothetical protein